jgi:N-acetylneuraminate synthase
MVEFHLDLDGAGAEYSAGHCWLPKQIGPVIEGIHHGVAADGTGEKNPVEAEIEDRPWRADPADGLRPMRSVRSTWTP